MQLLTSNNMTMTKNGGASSGEVIRVLIRLAAVLQNLHSLSLVSLNELTVSLAELSNERSRLDLKSLLAKRELLDLDDGRFPLCSLFTVNDSLFD
ncbi:hypothetical protein T12_10786 [Trichinella patagoniensis]|uniref:Uncharacterized protein n=1 Tax=Trichinella patagoniensis TaxID=990121 RepID=A0A0V0ZRX2_9BILA|nr:hypothetical protein T12_10786 [Trichinella patagoniensis]